MYGPLPRPCEFAAVQFCPRLHEAPLTPREPTGEKVRVRNAEHGAILGVLRVEVRTAVLADIVVVDRDDDAVELGYAGHGRYRLR